MMTFFANLGDYLASASQLVGAASVLAAVVPGGQSVGVALQLARKVLDTVACNFGHAKNAK